MRKHLRWMLLLLIGATTGTYVEGSQRGKELLEKLKREGFQGVEGLSEPDIQAVKAFKESQEDHSMQKKLQQANAALYNMLLEKAPNVSGEVLLDSRLNGYRPISNENIRWLVDHNVIDYTGKWVGGRIIKEGDGIERGEVRLDPQGRPIIEQRGLPVCLVEVNEKFFINPRNKPQVSWLVRDQKRNLWAMQSAVGLLPGSNPHCQLIR